MSGPLLTDLDLAALLCSRVCHDVISPVGAIANGLEVLEDEDDHNMRQVAMELVKKSARQASAKLQFCRIAFGAAGSAGAMIDMGEAGDTAKAFVGEEKIKLEWLAPRETRAKTQVKLLLNMMLMGMSAVPRGGVVKVSLDGDCLQVVATGDSARIPEKTALLLSGSIGAEDLDARLVQPYFALRLAEQAGFTLKASVEGKAVGFIARPLRAQAAA